MSQQTFRADGVKWMLRNLKILALGIVVALPSWWLFTITDDAFFIVIAITAAFMGILLFLVGLFVKPKIVITDGELKFGKVDFKFADVVDVKHTKEEYIFFLASRRRMTVNLAHFSEKDKRSVDKILAEQCLMHLSREEAKEKIAGSFDVSGFEFAVTAKHSTWFYSLAIFIWVISGFAVLFSVIIILTSKFNDSEIIWTVTSLVIAALLSLGCFLIEKKIEKCVFAFKEDIFTLSCKGKTKFSFSRTDVAGVGMNVSGQNFISFRMQNGKKTILKLSPFRRKDIKFINDRIRSIFFLPDEKKQNNIFKS